MFKVKTLSFALLLVSSVMAMAVQAAQSSATHTVTGRAPVASAVGIAPAPAGSTTVTATYVFIGADNDAESTTAFQWYRNGAVLTGETGRNLSLNQSGIGGDIASVQVTPGTNPAITDPSSGTAVRSADSRFPAGAIFARFITPISTRRNWADANTYCTALGGGARLPTSAELQQLFADSTRSPTFYPNSGYIENAELCSVHGWPLGGQCGGSSYNYWSNTSGSAGSHYYVSLRNGTAGSYGDSNTPQVACVR